MPCFDEPNFKAKFILSIIRENRFRSSFSNIPLDKTSATNEKNWEIDNFVQSAQMPTYLLSIIVHGLQTAKINSPKYNVQIEIIFNRLTVNNEEVKYALQQAGIILDYFSDLFDVEFPYNKTRKN